MTSLKTKKKVEGGVAAINEDEDGGIAIWMKWRWLDLQKFNLYCDAFFLFMFVSALSVQTNRLYYNCFKFLLWYNCVVMERSCQFLYQKIFTVKNYWLKNRSFQKKFPQKNVFAKSSILKDAIYYQHRVSHMTMGFEKCFFTSVGFNFGYGIQLNVRSFFRVMFLIVVCQREKFL